MASYLFASESYKDAATRRFDEELGVSAPPLTSLGKTEMTDNGCLKFISIFTTKSDGPFRPLRSQINELKFYSPVRIERMIADRTRPFTPTFTHVFGYYMSRFR